MHKMCSDERLFCSDELRRNREITRKIFRSKCAVNEFFLKHALSGACINTTLLRPTAAQYTVRYTVSVSLTLSLSVSYSLSLFLSFFLSVSLGFSLWFFLSLSLSFSASL